MKYLQGLAILSYLSVCVWADIFKVHCEPETIVNVHCNKCLCSDDGNELICTELDCSYDYDVYEEGKGPVSVEDRFFWSSDSEEDKKDFRNKKFLRSFGTKLGKFAKALGKVASLFESENDVNKESGNLDGLLRNVVKTFSEGLDTKMAKTTEKGFKNNIKLIVPGTYWCGDGSITDRTEELGIFNDTDSCCREHDRCPIGIASNDTKYGLTNTGLFTRSHCQCDSDFYNCLKKVGSPVSRKIGFTYFTILGPQCFKEEYPVTGCKKVGAPPNSRCLDYEVDKRVPKKWQWFDNPNF